jgi:cell division protein FtsW
MPDNAITKSKADSSAAAASRKVFGGDASLWIVIVALSIISLLVVYSSTAPMAYSKAGGNTSFYVINQLRFLLLGFIAIFIIHRIPYQSYLKYTRLLFAFAIVLMLLTFFVGVSSNEATRSLKLGGVTFQPADFVKITLIMTLAKALARRQKGIEKQELLPHVRLGLTDRDRERNRRVWHENTVPLLAPVALSCGLIFFSNFSTAALLFMACLVMMYVGRVRVAELWRLVLTVVLAVTVAVAVMYPLDIGRSRVWVGRVMSFADIEQVDKTSTIDERSDDQVLNAKMAISSGGLVGRGPGRSVQRTNLALPFSDYAYAFIAEEYGLAGCVVMLALYLWLFFRTTVIFRTCEKAFPGLLVLGLGILIVLQALVSMLVAVDMFPVTGLPLPLVSLGGSSILFTSIALGMILGISRQMQEKTIDENATV